MKRKAVLLNIVTRIRVLIYTDAYNNMQTEIKCGFVSHVFSIINLYTSVDVWTRRFVEQLAFFWVSANNIREHTCMSV